MFLASRSTDFEVHRNWLAITHNLPINKWYFESTSQWTLDYPPFFAWFEKLWSLLARIWCSDCLIISKNAIETNHVILFQRTSVIVSDIVYLYAIYQWLVFLSRDFSFKVKERIFEIRDAALKKNLPEDDCDFTQSWFHPSFIQLMLLSLSPGLILVDHIHFQYNGFLTGIFLLSLVRMCEGDVIMSSFWFAVLLNLKHIYIYAAPAFFVFILRNHCLDRHYNINIKSLARVATTVILVFAFSFGPFTFQLKQVLSRLFPFKRGLTHAYWAPNFWSVYNFADLVLYKVLKPSGPSPAYTSGIVQEFSHIVLPNIRPLVTFTLTGIAMIPALTHLWKVCHFHQPLPHCDIFLRVVTLCCFSSFMFLWHVHEKAILLIILPLTLLTRYGGFEEVKIFIITTMAGVTGLFPLFPPSVDSIKIMITLSFLVYAIPALSRLVFKGKSFEETEDLDEELLNRWEFAYLLGFLPLQIFCSFVHPFFLYPRAEFFPLALQSVYCSLGIMYSFLRLYVVTISNNI